MMGMGRDNDDAHMMGMGRDNDDAHMMGMGGITMMLT